MIYFGNIKLLCSSASHVIGFWAVFAYRRRSENICRVWWINPTYTRILSRKYMSEQARARVEVHVRRLYVDIHPYVARGNANGIAEFRDHRVTGETSSEGLSSRHGRVSSLHAIGIGISMPWIKFRNAQLLLPATPSRESLLRTNTFRCDLSRGSHWKQREHPFDRKHINSTHRSRHKIFTHLPRLKLWSSQPVMRLYVLPHNYSLQFVSLRMANVFSAILASVMKQASKEKIGMRTKLQLNIRNGHHLRREGEGGE